VKKGKKNVSVEFRVFGKKMKMKERFREKKSKCFELKKFFGFKVVVFAKI
jgi:hypothetical protein